jgi:hypothetical protein
MTDTPRDLTPEEVADAVMTRVGYLALIGNSEPPCAKRSDYVAEIAKVIRAEQEMRDAALAAKDTEISQLALSNVGTTELLGIANVRAAEFKRRAETADAANVALLHNTDKEIARLTGERDEYRRAYRAVMEAAGLTEPCEPQDVKDRVDRLTAEANVGTKDGPCYYCGEPTESRSARPTLWPVRLCHADEPGVSKPHHRGCIDVRLAEYGLMAANLRSIFALAEPASRHLSPMRPHFVTGMQHVEKPDPTPMPSPGVCAADAAKASKTPKADPTKHIKTEMRPPKPDPVCATCGAVMRYMHNYTAICSCLYDYVLAHPGEEASHEKMVGPQPSKPAPPPVQVKREGGP